MSKSNSKYQNKNKQNIQLTITRLLKFPIQYKNIYFTCVYIKNYCIQHRLWLSPYFFTSDFISCHLLGGHTITGTLAMTRPIEIGPKLVES